MRKMGSSIVNIRMMAYILQIILLKAQAYLELGKNTRYDYTYDDDRIGRAVGEFFGDVATQPNRSVAEAIETYRHVMTTLVEKWMLPNYKTVSGE